MCVGGGQTPYRKPYNTSLTKMAFTAGLTAVKVYVIVYTGVTIIVSTACSAKIHVYSNGVNCCDAKNNF